MAIEPTAYEICIRGHLGSEWTDWFGEFAMVQQYDGEGLPVTVMTGPVRDQSALSGILIQLNDINCQLISVNPVLAAPTVKERKL